MMGMELKGWENLGAALKLVPDKMQNRILRKSIYDAAKIVRDRARIYAPKRSQAYTASRTRHSMKAQARMLKKLSVENINTMERVKTRSKWQVRKAGTLKKGIIIGTPRGKRAYTKNGVTQWVGLNKKAFYGRWIEKGWLHKTSKSGKTTSIQARPFLRPAFDQNKQAVIDRMGMDIKLHIGEVVRA